MVLEKSLESPLDCKDQDDENQEEKGPQDKAEDPRKGEDARAFSPLLSSDNSCWVDPISDPSLPQFSASLLQAAISHDDSLRQDNICISHQ